MVLSVSLPILASCSSNGSSPTPTISGSQAPAPGSQEGVHSVADTDYEQIALAVDTTQVQLDDVAADPARKASPAILAIANSPLQPSDRRRRLCARNSSSDGNATTSDHHKPAVSSGQVDALKQLSGTGLRYRVGAGDDLAQ